MKVATLYSTQDQAAFAAAIASDEPVTVFTNESFWPKGDAATHFGIGGNQGKYKYLFKTVGEKFFCSLPVVLDCQRRLLSTARFFVNSPGDIDRRIKDMWITVECAYDDEDYATPRLSYEFKQAITKRFPEYNKGQDHDLDHAFVTAETLKVLFPPLIPHSPLITSETFSKSSLAIPFQFLEAIVRVFVDTLLRQLIYIYSFYSQGDAEYYQTCLDLNSKAGYICRENFLHQITFFAQLMVNLATGASEYASDALESWYCTEADE